MNTAIRYAVHVLGGAGELTPARDPDGEPVYRVGLVEERVRAAAIEAADVCAEREPERRFIVATPEGEWIYEAHGAPVTLHEEAA